jgi:hypothetical protein
MPFQAKSLVVSTFLEKNPIAPIVVESYWADDRRCRLYIAENSTNHKLLVALDAKLICLNS